MLRKCPLQVAAFPKGLRMWSLFHLLYHDWPFKKTRCILLLLMTFYLSSVSRFFSSLNRLLEAQQKHNQYIFDLNQKKKNTPGKCKYNNIRTQQSEDGTRTDKLVKKDLTKWRTFETKLKEEPNDLKWECQEMSSH